MKKQANPKKNRADEIRRATSRPPDWLGPIILAQLAEQSQRLTSLNLGITDRDEVSPSTWAAIQIIKHDGRRALVNALPYLQTQPFPTPRQMPLPAGTVIQQTKSISIPSKPKVIVHNEDPFN